MPGRRPVKKGSFSGHFDELVKHFPDEQRAKDDESARDEKPKHEDDNVHDRLFEGVWHKAPQGHPHD